MSKFSAMEYTGGKRFPMLVQDQTGKREFIIQECFRFSDIEKEQKVVWAYVVKYTEDHCRDHGVFTEVIMSYDLWDSKDWTNDEIEEYSIEYIRQGVERKRKLLERRNNNV